MSAPSDRADTQLPRDDQLGTTSHDNAADAIGDLWLCVEDPDTVAHRYARYADRRLERHGQSRVLTLDRAAVVFTTPPERRRP